MKIVIEILLDEAQLKQDDIVRLTDKLRENVPFIVQDLFWYREKRTLDYEVCVNVED